MSSEPGTGSQSTAAERIRRLTSMTGLSAAYIILVIGCLLSILTTTHLTTIPFLIFTLLQGGYCAILWWLRRHEITGSHSCSDKRLVLSLILFVLITITVGLLPLLGLKWDWLQFLVTVSLLFIFLPWRISVAAGILLYIVMAVNLGFLDNWHWSDTYDSLLTLLPAFIFVATFSVELRVREAQKMHAENLLRQLEVSNTEREKAHKQLQTYADEVQELTIRRERTRMAREIHDSLGHYLSILNIQLEMISKLQERDPARASIEIAEARRVASQSMQEVRNAIAALRPMSIATLTLPQPIADLGREFEQHADGSELTLDLDTELPSISPDLQVALYRAVQETLTNVRKHAHASKVLVRLRYEDEMLELMVLDNGRGPGSDDTSGQPGD